jgi:hypothetical protein
VSHEKGYRDRGDGKSSDTFRSRRGELGPALRETAGELRHIEHLKEQAQHTYKKLKKPRRAYITYALCGGWMAWTLFTAESLLIWVLCIAWMAFMACIITGNYFMDKRLDKTMRETLELIDKQLGFTQARLESLKLMKRAEELREQGNREASLMLMQESIKLLKEHTDAELPPEVEAVLTMAVLPENGEVH